MIVTFETKQGKQQQQQEEDEEEKEEEEKHNNNKSNRIPDSFGMQPIAPTTFRNTVHLFSPALGTVTMM
jgi:hypothetical protein